MEQGQASEFGPYRVLGALGHDEGVLLGVRDGRDEIFEVVHLPQGGALHAPAVLPSLKHAGLCVVVHVDASAVQPFFVRDHIPGVVLEDVLRHLRGSRERRLPEGLSTFISTEILGALDFLHRQRDPVTRAGLGLGHGHLSGASVLIGFAGEVKLRDFGLTRVKPKQDLLAAASLLAGLYATPPRPLASAQGFSSCAALAGALADGLGRSDRVGNKALAELMSTLFPEQAGAHQKRLRQLVKTDASLASASAKVLSERKSKAAAVASPHLATEVGAEAVRDRGEVVKQIVAVNKASKASAQARRAGLAVGGLLGAVLFCLWAYNVVVWFQEAGMLPRGENAALLHDPPTLPADIVRSSTGGRRGKQERPRRALRTGPAKESSMGTSSSSAGGEAQGVLEGCRHPCAGPVLKAVQSGGRVTQRDDEVELVSTNLAVCLSLCRSQVDIDAR